MDNKDLDSNKLNVRDWMFEPCPFTDETFQLQWMSWNDSIHSNIQTSTSLNIHLAHIPVEIEPKQLVQPMFLDHSSLEKEIGNDGNIILSENQDDQDEGNQNKDQESEQNNVFCEYILKLLEEEGPYEVNSTYLSSKTEQDWINALKSEIILNYKLNIKNLIYLLKQMNNDDTCNNLAIILLLKDDNDILCSILRQDDNTKGNFLIKKLSSLLFNLTGLFSKFPYSPLEFRHFLLNLDLRNKGGEAGIELETCLGEEYANRL